VNKAALSFPGSLGHLTYAEGLEDGDGYNQKSGQGLTKVDEMIEYKKRKFCKGVPFL
jgi:hypothetical protein